MAIEKSNILLINVISHVGIGLLEANNGILPKVYIITWVLVGMVCLVMNLGAQSGSRAQQLITLSLTLLGILVAGFAANYAWVRQETDTIFKLLVMVTISIVTVSYLTLQLIQVGKTRIHKK